MRFWVVIFSLFWSTAAQGEGLGLVFAAFPPGTIFDYRDSADGPFVEIYRGKQGALHVLERRRGSEFGDVELTRFFNEDGMETAREYANGREVAYAPYNCERALGPCSHTVSTSRGERSVQSETTKRPGGYAMTMTFEGVTQPRRRFFRVAEHGVIDFIRENDRQRKLETIRRP